MEIPIERLQSGFPFILQLEYNPSNDRDTYNLVHPHFILNFMSNLILGGPNRHFIPNTFIALANAFYGNVGRDILTGPGHLEFDFSLMKDTTLTE